MQDLRERGILIAIEGIDGAGKTTQVDLLKNAFEAIGEEPIATKEPTDGPWGRKIRESAETGRMSLEEELDAFIQDRTEHVKQVIEPALNAGSIVILDRYFYSTIAYQGARGADTAAIKSKMESLFPVPDIVFLLDIEPADGLRRISESRKDKPNEFEKAESLAKARAIFNSLNDEHITRLDGSLAPETIHRGIVAGLVFGPLRVRRGSEVWTTAWALTYSQRG